MEQRLGAGQSEAPYSGEIPSRQKPVILIMGVEGSGKSVHAKLIAQKYDLPTVVMGDEFRELAKNDITGVGIAAKKMLEAGEYSTDELFWSVFDNRFKKDDVRNGVVMDGVFRTVGQIQGFKEKIKQYIGDANITVFFLRTPIWQGAFRATERGGVYDTEERILSRQREFFRGLGQRIILIKNEKLRFIQIMTGNKSIQETNEEIVRKYEEAALS